MHPFTLSRPTDISAAITAHAHDAHFAFIAGGTDLIGLMKDRVTLPDRLLDINHLSDLARIEAFAPDGKTVTLPVQDLDAIAAFGSLRRAGSGTLIYLTNPGISAMIRVWNRN